LPRPRIAAAAAPNRIIIGGAGTGVPLLPDVPELPDEELLEDELLDEDDDDELELVLLVMLPELEPLVEMPLEEELPDEEDDDELDPLDEPEPPLELP
jgi:hypothetical protein